MRAFRLISPLVVVLGTLAALVAASAAPADPQSRPDGPWVQDSQHVSLDGFRSYDQLVSDLEQLAASSHGRIRLEVIGSSNEGRAIHLAKVGTGERKVLYITQQHGNEPHGTEAAIEALRTLGSSQHPEVRRIREDLTVLMVVRANPDGAERGWRQNVDPECDPALASCLPGRGYDINRWHDPRIADADVPVPETLAIRELYRRHRPELVVDYHGQLTYLSGDGEMITTSLLWPLFPSEVEVTPEREAAIAYSKQASVLMHDSLVRYGHAEVTTYPFGTTMGTARVAYGYLGSGSVLFEQRSNAGQKSVGMLVRQAYVAMLDTAQAVADGSLRTIDPARADDLPARGPLISNPNGDKRSEVACPRVDGGGAGTVLAAEDSLYDFVVAYEAERIMPRASNTYVRPTLEQACRLAAAFDRIVAGDLAAAAALADPLGYDVVRLSDPDTGRRHVLLAERPAGDTVARGWGLYAHAPGSASRLTVQAAYPQSANFSERLAAQLFDAADARNLFVAGAHRNANDADEVSTEPANVTDADNETVFQRMHEVAVRGAGDVAVQTLGATGGENEVAVTAGQVPPTTLAEQVAAIMRNDGYEVCLYGDGTCTRLPSTTNVQGVSARANGADWVALYPSFAIRSLLASRQALAESLAPAFDPAQ